MVTTDFENYHLSFSCIFLNLPRADSENIGYIEDSTSDSDSLKRLFNCSRLSSEDKNDGMTQKKKSRG